jgi:hypothetical protein
LAGTLAFSTAPARADGDPASDVLTTEPLFLPQDAGIPAAQQAQLVALVRSASGGGGIRVALIASPADLGSISALWREPASYAAFLGEELSLVYHGLLLVVMPNGFGLYDHGQSTARYGPAIAGIVIHPTGGGLAATTITAIRRLAAASGHPLALPHVQVRANAGRANQTPWIVFGLGLVLIALAWAASLRARPLGQPRSA